MNRVQRDGAERRGRIWVRAIYATGAAVLLGLGVTAALGQIFPTDSANTSPASIPNHPFSSWFESGRVTAGGMVKPPDSAGFSGLPPGEAWGDWRVGPNGIAIPPPGAVIPNTGSGYYGVAQTLPGTCAAYAPAYVVVPASGYVPPLSQDDVAESTECPIQVLNSWPPPGLSGSAASSSGGYGSGGGGSTSGSGVSVYDDGGYRPALPPQGPVSPYSGQFSADFYRWAYQMFLHVTSPSGDTSSGSDPIFMSPEFYVLSTPDPKTGNYTLLEQGKGSPHAMDVRRNKPRTNDFATIKDKSGVPYRILPAKLAADGNRLVKDANGKDVEIAAALLDSLGRLVFLDAGGQPVQVSSLPTTSDARDRLRLQDPADAANVAFKVNVGSKTVFTNRKGKVIPTDDSVGETDGLVELTKAVRTGDGTIRSLIYYNIEVNDAWAYYQSMVRHGQGAGQVPRFPASQSDLAPVISFAASHGKSIAHPSALVVELKTAWVDAAVVKHPEQYITVMAQVPNYDTSDPERWVPKGTKRIKVALVGMHIVGSTQGHPDMVWATFEHLGNAPDHGYTYMNDHRMAVGVPTSQGHGDWLFDDGPVEAIPILLPGAKMGPDGSIVAMGSGPVRNNPAIRLSPFGTPSDLGMTSLSDNGAYNNSDVISMNVSVANEMPANDPRRYYYLVGATWTLNGSGNMGIIDQTTTPNPPAGSLIEGGPFLANSSMETFEQAATLQAGLDSRGRTQAGCSMCHNQTSGEARQGDTTVLSHVFSNTLPLFR